MKKLIAFLMVVALSPAFAHALMGKAVNTSNGNLLVERTYKNGTFLVQTHNLQDDSYTTYSAGRPVQTTMAGDVIANYKYDGGKLVSVTDQYGNQTMYKNGQKTKTVNHKGFTTKTYDYDSAGRMKSVQSYDENGNKVENGKTTYNYDGSILKSVKSYNTNTDMWETTHYDSGKQTKTVAENGVTTARFHYNGVKLASVTNYDANGGAKTGTTYFDNHGRASYTKDMSGNLVSENIYSGAKIIQSISYPGGEYGQFIHVTEYDSHGVAGDTTEVQNPKWNG